MLLLVLCSSGCSAFEDEGDDRSIPVVGFQVEAQTSQSVRFLVTGTWTDTCGTFSRFETSRSDRAYVVTMYGARPAEARVCGDAITTISATWSTEVPSAGSYTFQFRREGAAPLDTTLVFEGG
ncbi:MAG: hypothetical protein AAGG50_16460 [Bacteroidota bacterium]